MVSNGITKHPLPQHFLKGIEKKARHVKIICAEDVDDPALRELIKADAMATSYKKELRMHLK